MGLWRCRSGLCVVANHAVDLCAERSPKPLRKVQSVGII